MPDNESGPKAGDEARRALRKSKLTLTKVAVQSGADPHIDVGANILGIIVEQKGIPKERVVANARLREDLGFDDLDFIEFIFAAEERFGIEIPDDVADRIRTVGDAITTVRNMLGDVGGV